MEYLPAHSCNMAYNALTGALATIGAQLGITQRHNDIQSTEWTRARITDLANLAAEVWDARHALVTSSTDIPGAFRAPAAEDMPANMAADAA